MNARAFGSGGFSRHVETPAVEVLRKLEPGTSVRLPDGDRGRVVEQNGCEVLVIQPQRTIGRGPWLFQRWQLEPL